MEEAIALSIEGEYSLIPLTLPVGVEGKPSSFIIKSKENPSKLITIHQTWERPAIPSGWACSIHDMRHFKEPLPPPKKALPKQIKFGF